MQHRELAVSALAFDRAGRRPIAAEDDVVRAPAVVGALAVAREGASEVAGGKSDDLVREVVGGNERRELFDGRLERTDCFTQLVEEIGV